ncbi:hypothetical protein [Streptacidiphilus carbonis]|uniref:hypothetical protein n=1 Tax=Streptacidiphilus carbonis TaxID=105422 RepID=UPI00126A576C|nr:hypothetical protein [Streptacidiphilus carbonis]
MTISDLNERRRRAAERVYDGLMCPCGDAWFVLRTDDGPGAVVLDSEGTVTGYSGVPHCMSCGAVVSVP